MKAALLFLIAFAVAAPPEISLTVHRVVDEDQNVNETLVVQATHDLIILQASEIQYGNETDLNSTEIEHSFPRHPREANVTHNGHGKLTVQLPIDSNSTSDVVVGEGTHVVNQVNGQVAVESHGGWHLHIESSTVTRFKDHMKSTDYLKRITIYDTG